MNFTTVSAEPAIQSFGLQAFCFLDRHYPELGQSPDEHHSQQCGLLAFSFTWQPTLNFIEFLAIDSQQHQARTIACCNQTLWLTKGPTRMKSDKGAWK